MQKHSLDVLVAPSGVPAWLIPSRVETNGPPSPSTTESAQRRPNLPQLTASCAVTALAGYPLLVVPMGSALPSDATVDSHPMPVGLSFMGTAGADAALLNFGFSFEQAMLKHQPSNEDAGVQCIAPEPRFKFSLPLSMAKL